MGLTRVSERALVRSRPAERTKLLVSFRVEPSLTVDDSRVLLGRVRETAESVGHGAGAHHDAVVEVTVGVEEPHRLVECVVVDGATELVVGRRGQVFFTDLAAATSVAIELPAGRCVFAVEPPGASAGDAIPQTGALVCQREERPR